MKALIFILLFGSFLFAQKFASIGDYGQAGANELAVANLVKSWIPDFIITLGDNNYDNGAAATIDENIGQYYHEYIYPYTGSYGLGSDVNRFFPSLGNHDWFTAGVLPYLDYFELPNNERYYDFTWGNIHFFVIDSDENEPDGSDMNSIQANWIQNQLSLSASIWNIVYVHHAPYSSGQHGSTARMQWPYKDWGADVVMASHDHTYERIIYEDFPYFVNGLGGKSRYAFVDTVQGSAVRYNQKYGAMLMEANAEQISFDFYNVDSELIDHYVIAKGVPITPTDLVAVINSDPLFVELSWVDNSNYEDGYIIERSDLDSLLFEVIDTVDQNVTNYMDTTLSTATYYYRISAFNGYGNSAYSNIAQVIVPVEMISFSATVMEGNIILKWITATETNNMGFEIQKKTEQKWTQLGFVEGQGSITSPHQYQFIDEQAVSGKTNVYRLKQIDFNGSFCYSPIVEVDLPLREFLLEQNYPNPFNPSTTIRYNLPADGTVTIKLFNIFGEEVNVIENEFKRAGGYSIIFNAEGLASGIYFYRLQFNNYSETKKMILLR